MEFIDANTTIGRPPTPTLRWASASDLIAAMDRAGIARAIVRHVAGRDADPLTGNRLLAEAIADYRDRLVGCWAILPTQSREIGDVDAFFAKAAEAGVPVFCARPAENRYLLRADVIGDLAERMIAARRPLMLKANEPHEWQAVHDLLAELPELTVILTDIGCWGADRYFRPLVERYPNVHVEIADYFVDGGIESFVADYGPRQLLYGSGFPTRYPGAMMMAVRSAEISDADKVAVAGGNFERLLAEVKG